MITPGERVARVLERDERLVEVFVAASPAFTRLRSPAMRRIMARLVSVEQAAKMAGLDAAALVARLNDALAKLSGSATEGVLAAAEMPAGGASARTEEERMEDTPEMLDVAESLRAMPPEQVVEVDVREELRNGQEPFSRIMAAQRSVPEGGVLMLRAIFEPVPLYRVMEKQGLGHHTERLAEDDWVVWFFAPGTLVGGQLRGASSQSERTAGTWEPATGDQGDEVEEGVLILDVRGMEPPEPMVRTLAALETLPAGATLVQLNERVPKFLLPKLAELGFTYEVREQSGELVRVFIRRREA